MVRLHFTAARLFARAAPLALRRLAILLDTGGGAGDFLVLDHTCLRGDAQHALYSCLLACKDLKLPEIQLTS